MNECMNEWGGLFRCLCHVFEVCADGSYLSIWRGNHVVVDAFSQRAVTCRTNLSIKGTWTHKYHQRGVRAERQSPSSFLPFTSGARATVLPLEPQSSWAVWSSSQLWSYPCAGIFRWHQLGMWFTSGRRCLSVYYDVIHGITRLFWFPSRTVNNFLMTGPKVNTFCSSYDFKAHTLHHVNLQAIFKMTFFLFPVKAFLTYANSVQIGAQRGLQECKHQFAWERWNCPENSLQLSTHSGLRRGEVYIPL